jgi:hypothetical protein
VLFALRSPPDLQAHPLSPKLRSGIQTKMPAATPTFGRMQIGHALKQPVLNP